MPRSPRPVESEDDEHMDVDKTKNDAKDGSDAEQEDGSEYEIEEILDAKRGAFPNGRMGYLVKWKGYGPADNSWVDEQDTENATELVEEFWRKNPKKKQRKSMDPTPKPPAKRARKSIAADDTSDTTSVAKKRGRKSSAKDSEAEDDDVPSQPKKARNVTEKASSKKTKESVEPQSRLGNMGAHMDKKNWEDLIDTVDTVERTDDGLLIYFTLKTGESVVENSSICRERFPVKMLNFYESNLKWRRAEED